MNKRYILEKLIESDSNARLTVWQRTKVSSNNPETLKNFLTQSYRIFDTKLNTVHCDENSEPKRKDK